MTSFLHDLEEQLRAAAHDRTAGSDAPAPTPPPRGPRRRTRWAWLAGGARAVPVLVAVAVTLAVVVGALVLLGHRGGQPPTPPASGGPDNAFAALVEKTPKAQLKREFSLMGAATRKVQASGACRVAQPRTPPQIHDRPGHVLLSTLGVLRRPPTRADRLPPDSMSEMGPGIAIYAGATRRAGQIEGTSYYLVPIRQDPAGAVPSARCFALQKAALDNAIPTFPQALRSPVRKLEAALIAFATSLAAAPPSDAVCEVTAQRNGGGMSCSETADEIRHGLFPGDDNGVLSGLVPDGVASVKVTFRGRSAIAPVHGNVYAVRVGVSGPFKPGSPVIAWRAADGHVVRSYTEPPQSSLKQVCRQHPEACIAAVALSEGTQVSASSSSASATVRSQPSPRPKGSGG
jgi:hypothetical protein